MKLIIAVVQDRDANELLRALTESGHRATKLSSSGGFLRSGNTTMLIGTEESRMEDVMRIIHSTCKAREQMMAAVTPALGGGGEAWAPFPTQVLVGGATVFVLDVERFEKW